MQVCLGMGWNRGAYYWGHSFAKIDDRILHCLSIKKVEIAEPG